MLAYLSTAHRSDPRRRQRQHAGAGRPGPQRRGALRRVRGHADDRPDLNADGVHRVRLLERGSDDMIAQTVLLPGAARPHAAVLRRTAPRHPAPSSPPAHCDRRPPRKVPVDDRPVEVRARSTPCCARWRTHPGVHTQRAHERDLGPAAPAHGPSTATPPLRIKLADDTTGWSSTCGASAIADRWAIASDANTVGGSMSEDNGTPRSVVALYQQLAAERAGAARAALARERTVEGLFAQAPPRSRTPPARCCTPRPRSSRSTGRYRACSPSRPARCSRSPRGSRRPPT